MTKELQRIAIAKVCGWEWRPYADTMAWMLDGKVVWWEQVVGLNPKIVPVDPLPDYLNDLNAMHEAEKMLSDDGEYSQRNHFACILGELTYNDNGRGWKPLCNDDCFPILHATAAQRAEAFLKTLGLWENSPA